MQQVMREVHAAKEQHGPNAGESEESESGPDDGKIKLEVGEVGMG